MTATYKASAVYRLIMVKKINNSNLEKFSFFQIGSGGVGKSALTLQYMYDEVRKKHKYSFI